MTPETVFPENSAVSARSERNSSCPSRRSGGKNLTAALPPYVAVADGRALAGVPEPIITLRYVLRPPFRTDR